MCVVIDVTSSGRLLPKFDAFAAWGKTILMTGTGKTVNGEIGSGGETELLHQQPVFSVVIPTFNRSETLARVLGSWSEQVPEKLAFEIVVVDDGSTDGTAGLLESYCSNRYRLLFRTQPNQGPAAARNRALKLGTGEYILFTGDDIEPTPDLLDRHLSAHRQMADGRVAVLGKIEWAPNLVLTSTMRHVDGVGAQQFSYWYMKDGEEYDYRHFYTSNVSVSSELLRKEPLGFSTDFPLAAFEDAEFAFRLRRHGLRIIYQSTAQAWHHHPYDVKTFYRRQIDCGRMGAVLIRKWPQTSSLLGGNQVLRRIHRPRFVFGTRRRIIGHIESTLKTREDLAIQIASEFDHQPASSLDAYLSGLFQYAYQKGMAEAWFPPQKALRLCAHWFLDLVVNSAEIFRRELDERSLERVGSQLAELVTAGR